MQKEQKAQVSVLALLFRCGLKAKDEFEYKQTKNKGN
jgi:hypothetical protein